MTLHIGEKGHSTWQGRAEMGLKEAVWWRREAWSLVPRPDFMDASSFLNCRMGDLSPSLDLSRPSCRMGGRGTWLVQKVSRRPDQPGGFYPSESVSAISSLWKPQEVSLLPVGRMSLAVLA